MHFCSLEEFTTEQLQQELDKRTSLHAEKMTYLTEVQEKKWDAFLEVITKSLEDTCSETLSVVAELLYRFSKKDKEYSAQAEELYVADCLLLEKEQLPVMAEVVKKNDDLIKALCSTHACGKEMLEYYMLEVRPLFDSNMS